MSDGAKTGSKKPHYTQLMKDEIERLKAENEALRAAKATTGESVSTSVAPPPVVVEAKPPVVDPLAWITEDTPAVFLVSSTSTFHLRPEDKAKSLKMLELSETTDPQSWFANPFDYRNEDRIAEQNNKVLTSKWHHLRLKQEVAEEYWEREKKGPWTETVIDPKKYRGWNKLRRRPEGETDPITEFVPLRELTRWLLQKNSMTFLNWGHHKDDFDPRYPNPYNNRLPGVSSVIKQEMAAMVGKHLDSRRAGGGGL